MFSPFARAHLRRRRRAKRPQHHVCHPLAGEHVSPHHRRFWAGVQQALRGDDHFDGRQAALEFGRPVGWLVGLVGWWRIGCILSDEQHQRAACRVATPRSSHLIERHVARDHAPQGVDDGRVGHGGRGVAVAVDLRADTVERKSGVIIVILNRTEQGKQMREIKP
jgi:hypothetical protein